MGAGVKSQKRWTIRNGRCVTGVKMGDFGNGRLRHIFDGVYWVRRHGIARCFWSTGGVLFCGGERCL